MTYTCKLNFALLLSHFLVNLSTRNIDKIVSVLFSQHQWTCVDSTFLFNPILMLKQDWVINIESRLFQRCFVNVETTSINIRSLNFHFQPNFNVETMLVHRRWIDVILSTLFQRYFINVDVFAGLLLFSFMYVHCISMHFPCRCNIIFSLNVTFTHLIVSCSVIFFFFFWYIMTQNSNDVITMGTLENHITLEMLDLW